MRAKHLATTLGLLAASLLGGCGQVLDLPFQDTGGGGGGGSTPISVNLPSSAALDGMVFSNGSVVSAGGGPLTGDLDTSINGISVRQYFSFSLATLPPGAAISAAQIELRQAAVRGTPYTSHGVVLLEHVDYGASLDPGDYPLAPLAGFSATLSSTPTIEWKTLDVTARVLADIAAARTRFQVRLRFTLASDSDSSSDAAEFGDAEGSAHASSAPVLRVTYSTP